MRRIPPPLAALAAVVLVAGVVVALFAAFGPKEQAPRCSAALAAGPYRCVVFVSASGTENGVDQPWLRDGVGTFQVVQGPRIVLTGGCNTIEGDVTISGTGYRTGDLIGGMKACPGEHHDDWMRALFTGSQTVVEHDDATVTVTNGTRTAVFREIIARG